MKIIRSIEGFEDYDKAIKFGTLLMQSNAIQPLNFRFHRKFSDKKKYIYTLGVNKQNNCNSCTKPNSSSSSSLLLLE